MSNYFYAISYFERSCLCVTNRILLACEGSFMKEASQMRWNVKDTVFGMDTGYI